MKNKIDRLSKLPINLAWNDGALNLNSVLQRQCGITVYTKEAIEDLVTLNPLDVIRIVKIVDESAQISAVTTRFKARSGMKFERIRQAQDDKSWSPGLKKYLVGEIWDLMQDDIKVFGSIAMNYEVDQSNLFFYRPST
ncbi:reverse transcriptase [Phytophthora megakarya]|uniref:Reverse transcriptase n=1 Tax=Phytophthora megakarya TaxID=4795 RepID=A0A225WPP5_9STRA|nr:reverse transcriptase [Phytophthora megakarya]